MAYNDLFVVIYKILSYFYECMKAGVSPRLEDFCCTSKMLRVPEQYWNQVVVEMQDEGFLKGFIATHKKNGLTIIMNEDAHITIKGVEFLKNNSNMAEVESFLGQSFMTVLSATIETIVSASIR